MRKKIYTVLLCLFINLSSHACECEHLYELEIMTTIDLEEDIERDDYLYEMGRYQDLYKKDPDRLLKEATYAFDKFKYNKCLEKIKEYERYITPPPPQVISVKDEIIISTYKAYCNRFLKRYHTAINYFENVIKLLDLADREVLSPECKFITYVEHAQCYLLKGDKAGFKKRMKKIFDMKLAPNYQYYVDNDFEIHHQPCFHYHKLNTMESFVFNQAAPLLLGEELFANMARNQQVPKVYTKAQVDDEPFCRRLCARASYVSALLIGLVTKSEKAMALTIALAELLIDCETCCKEGLGSENCLSDFKTILNNACNQELLEGL